MYMDDRIMAIRIPNLLPDFFRLCTIAVSLQLMSISKTIILAEKCMQQFWVFFNFVSYCNTHSPHHHTTHLRHTQS